MVKEGTVEHLDCPVKIQRTDQENVECLDLWVTLVHLAHKENLVVAPLETILGHVVLQENQGLLVSVVPRVKKVMLVLLVLMGIKVKMEYQVILEIVDQKVWLVNAVIEDHEDLMVHLANKAVRV